MNEKRSGFEERQPLYRDEPPTIYKKPSPESKERRAGTIYAAAMALVVSCISLSSDTSEHSFKKASIPLTEVQPNDPNAPIIMRLRSIPSLITSPGELSRRAPALALMLNKEGSTKARCETIRSILNAHLNDILEISVFMAGNAATLQHKDLKQSAEEQLQNILTMSPEQVVAMPQEYKSKITAHMKTTQGYKVIQSCNGLVLFFIQGLINGKIDKNMDKLSPAIEEMVLGIQNKPEKPGARNAIEALFRIEHALVSAK